MKKQLDGQINLFDYISSYSLDNDSPIKDLKFRDSEIISFYEECSSCWCSTCRHNEKGKAVPRDFAGKEKPCPSCDFCIEQNKAEICEIDSYDNGCKLRAVEEGIENPFEI